jgi:hypothetical protein
MNKTCGKCKINKSTDEFHKISGFTSYCKECKTLYRKNNIEQFRARKLRWYQKKKLQKSLIPKQKKIKDKNYKPAYKLKRKEKERLQNYGKYGWHIDHIIPCSIFDLTDAGTTKNMFPLY